MQSFEQTPPEARELLSRRIRDLGLRLEGSMLEKYVQQLYAELAAKGLERFRPAVYLSDEWACPDKEPIIGAPFYLADPKIAALERAVNDLEDEREILMYLRHEAGHAFNYAYLLYETKEWLDLFGPFDRPYVDDYKPIPFSRKYVRHIAGWYAQKHPDEDFAESFAVWLTPDSDWQRRYAGWPALRKVQYVDRTARALAATPPRKGLEVGRAGAARRGDGHDDRAVLPRARARRGGAAARGPRRRAGGHLRPQGRRSAARFGVHGRAPQGDRGQSPTGRACAGR